MRIEELSKSWRGFQLTDIDLEVHDGEYFVLLGPTGAGKSLLLEVLAGFHEPDRGRIILDGRDITALPPENRGIGYVPQADALFPHMTVRQNIEFGLKMRARSKGEIKEAADEASRMLGLEHFESRSPVTLSGGEKQKVALARTLVTKPSLILLDEPLSSVDQEGRRILREELKGINRKLGLTTIHVTHDQLEALSLAKRLGVIREGKIIRLGDTKEVFENPRNLFLARFLGYENTLVVGVKDKKGEFQELDLCGHTLKTAREVEKGTHTVGIHPNDISISRNMPETGENVLMGITRDFSDLGQAVMVTVDAGSLIRATISRRDFLRLGLDIRQEVWLSFPADAVKILE